MWTPEPWLGFLLLFSGGACLLLLGLIPLLPWYKTAREDDPTHPLSYIGSVVLGVILIACAFVRYFNTSR